MRVLHRVGAACFANLPYKVVALAIALILHYVAVHRISALEPVAPPAAECPCR